MQHLRVSCPRASGSFLPEDGGEWSQCPAGLQVSLGQFMHRSPEATLEVVQALQGHPKNCPALRKHQPSLNVNMVTVNS